MYGASSAYGEAWRREPVISIRDHPYIPLARVAETKQVVHITDLETERARDRRDPRYVRAFESAAARSLITVPMLKDNELIGMITVYRQEVRPFTKGQVDLLTSFAAQAVIAIENTRLLNELRQRTDDLTESLEQQTATSEVLKVISSSPGTLEPVFDAILENATRICDANFGNLVLYDGDVFRRVALHNAPPAWAADQQRDPRRRRADAPLLYRLVDTKEAVHVADLIVEVPDDNLTKFTSARSLVLVPMLKEGELIGAIGVYRQEVRPFSEKQIALLKNFAAQAVIAIENTRLLNELRQSLEQQTAMAEVLGVISSSPGEIDPVFETVLANATRLCEANFGVLQLCEDGGFRMVAMHNPPPAYAESRRRQPVIHPGPLTPPARVAATKRLLHVTDLTQEEAYRVRDPSSVRFVETAGVRTLLVVPMLKENELIGEISVYRQEVRTFTDRQIALLQNFAAQAVIAIENTRLLNELRQSLEQQTATADVLRVISASPGDLEPVFGAMLENATRICEANFGNMFLIEDGTFRTVAMHNAPAAYSNARTAGPFRPPADSAPGRLVSSKDVVHVADLRAEPTYLRRDPFSVTGVELAGIRTLLAVPMLKDNALIGAIHIYRQEVQPFTDKQIALVRNFAAQAVIAIENTRLLNELRQSLEQQTATSNVLRVISSSPGALEPVFTAMLENATRICDAKFGIMTLYEGGSFRAVALHNAPPEFAEARRREPLFSPAPNNPLARVAATKETLQIPDLRLDESYLSGEQATVIIAERGGARTLIDIPMLKDGELVGVFGIYRQEVRPFTDKQIELLQNFAGPGRHRHREHAAAQRIAPAHR